MATIRYHWQGDGVARLMGAADALIGSRKHAAFRRALNHVGDKSMTATKRALAQQMGLPVRKLNGQNRRIYRRAATGANLEYQIVTRGGAVRAKEFKHSVGKSGITFYPWGVAHRFKSAFVIKRWSGNFYMRRGKERFPLEALYGPNINKELVKDLSAAAFQRVVATDLPGRIAHEIKVITNGVVS